MAAKQRKSRRGTSTTTAVRSGTKLMKRLSGSEPRARKARDKVARILGTVGRPFWSNAHNAWRVEFALQDKDGRWHTSSFYCEHQDDATRLADEAGHGQATYEHWCELRELAVKLAGKSNGFLYRIMVDGSEETFKVKMRGPEGGFVR